MGAFSFFTRAELRAEGYTVERIRAEIGAGQLERVIRGWYCRPGANRDVMRAMRLGGRISCVSALALHGGWLPPEGGLHVGYPSHASGRRLARRDAPEGTVTHWHPKDAATGSSFAVTPIERAIEDLILCQPPAFVVATLDSLLHKRVVQRNRVGALILRGPLRTHFLAERLHPGAGSGIESIVRFALTSAGIDVQIQVVVRGVYRVDVIIDGWLVLEARRQGDACADERVHRGPGPGSDHHARRPDRAALQLRHRDVRHGLPAGLRAGRHASARSRPLIATSSISAGRSPSSRPWERLPAC